MASQEDESLDELRIEAVRKEEERKVQGRVDTAIATEQVRHLSLSPHSQRPLNHSLLH